MHIYIYIHNMYIVLHYFSSDTPLLRYARYRVKEWPVLVVAPTVVVDNWINEAEGKTNGGDGDLMVISWENHGKTIGKWCFNGDLW